MYIGRHWFADALGGYLYGVFYLLLLIAAYWKVKLWIQTGQALKLVDTCPRFLRGPMAYAYRHVIMGGLPEYAAANQHRHRE